MAKALHGLDDWHADVPRSMRAPILAGLLVLVVCCFGFTLWALYAPISGAVVTSGVFVVTGQNKQIQHLEGGILRDVLVREGDIVEAGQTLVQLDDTGPNVRLRRLVVREYRLLMTRARLEAQIGGMRDLIVPAALAEHAGDHEVKGVIDRQRAELHANRARLASEKEVLRKEIAGLRESIAGNQIQLSSARQRHNLFKEELTYKSQLLDRQLTRKSDVLAVQRAEAGLFGEVGELTGRIADAHERIARAEQQIVSLDSTATQKSVEELRLTETELDDVGEQIRAARDVMNRIAVKSPVRGAVVKLNHNTRGGVIAPGAVILELLPLEDELVIEARISPSDITHVHVGQSALARLSGLNQRLTPMVEGAVKYVSPDALHEQGANNEAASGINSRGGSFVIRVRLDEKDLSSKIGHFRATPGMPADLFIKTEDRTFADYLLRPVLDSFARAFREQ